MSTRRLVVGHWAAHGSPEQLGRLAVAARRRRFDCDAVLCVPWPLLPYAQTVLHGTTLACGAQAWHEHGNGALTGDVAVRMLGERGVRHVIVGHSERRIHHGATDEQVAASARCVADAGMTPIVCIGESAAERDANLTTAVLRRQLRPVVRALGRRFACAVLAYEPVWAADSGPVAPGLIDDAHRTIAHVLTIDAGLPPESLRILYGGCITPGNVQAVLSCDRVAGVLASGASLQPARFFEILRIASRRASLAGVPAPAA